MTAVVWVLATGSRYFWREDVVRVAFDAIEADYGWRGAGPHEFRLIHGACPWHDVEVSGREGPQMVRGSADMLAQGEAQRRENWTVVESAPGVLGFPADWGRYERAAGPVRNQQMVQFLQRQDGEKIVVGFPRTVSKRHPMGTSHGTRGCLRLAEGAGLRWWVAPLDMNTAAEDAA